MTKPVIVGEVNPYGPDPYYPMHPSPEGSAGHRLATTILGIGVDAYLARFERRNLSTGDWYMQLARMNAVEVRRRFSRIIACGVRVAAAFELPTTPFRLHDLLSCRVLVIPHPSGLCRVWNDLGAADRARAMVAELCPEVEELRKTLALHPDAE